MGDAFDPAQKPDVGQSNFDVNNLVSRLTIDEKIALISGTDFWHTASIPRLGIPAVRVSDGPNGVRGTKFFNGVPAACFPCGTALGATWDVDLIRQGGELLAHEAIAKGASAILGPTVNIQRSPLGGRGFESFSEDPFLSGSLSAAAINGIQSQGVAATLKHFVCNDLEDHRQSVNSIVTDRALREIYLMPFQIAQRDSQPMAIMTAYNKVNGIHCSEDSSLIQGVLRNEWGFDGLTMSDWFGTYSTVKAIKAGLDLEMPGATAFRGPLVTKALSSGKLSYHELDACARRILHFVKRLMPLGIPEYAPEATMNTPATSVILRKLAADSLVLLKNEDHVLPLNPRKKTAVIGPNAAIAAYCGGGSASLDAYYTVTPLAGVSSECDTVTYALGAPGWKALPLLSEMSRTKDGKKGLHMTVYLEPPAVAGRKAIDHIQVRKSDVLLMDYKHPELKSYLMYADLEGTISPEATGEYEFSVAVAGTSKLFIDDECVVDNQTNQTRGDSFFSTGTIEEVGTKCLVQGTTYQVRITFGSDPTITYERPGANGFGLGGIRIGATRKLDRAAELAKACEVASSVDQVILCVGLNSDWESEGYDRPHMHLPASSDDLVRAVSSANPNTAVVLQSGTPVTMSWINQVKTVVQAWYGGNECGNAIADVLFGKVNPGGKLPLSFPVRNQDNPAFLNYKSDRNRALYGEDVFVGYRYYEAAEREVLFPFGHGLSYTTFEFDSTTLSIKEEDRNILVSVMVRNTGNFTGTQVIQLYVQQKGQSIQRPIKELKGFCKVSVEAGSTERASIRVPKKYATSWWDEERNAWIQEAGEYVVLIGDSSANTPLSTSFVVEETTWWNGV